MSGSTPRHAACWRQARFMSTPTSSPLLGRLPPGESAGRGDARQLRSNPWSIGRYSPEIEGETARRGAEGQTVGSEAVTAPVPSSPAAPARRGRQGLAITMAVAATVPALVLRAGGGSPRPWLAAVLFGVAVVGAAFLLAWAAEALQLDVSQGLALAVLALIAVLPEYAVDLVFTW